MLRFFSAHCPLTFDFYSSRSDIPPNAFDRIRIRVYISKYIRYILSILFHAECFVFDSLIDLVSFA